jgi:phospholipid transport system substrate-binding protein
VHTRFPGRQGTLAGLLCLFAALANAAPAPGSDPQQLVIDTTDRMLSALGEHANELEREPAKIYDLVGDIVLPHFDFVRMSAWALGKYWRQADREQKRRFVRAFRQMLVRTYAVALLEYDEQKIEYLPLRGDPASGDVTVRTQVVQSGRAPIAINYALWERGGDWRVYDVSVDGISLVANFRTSFASEIKANGLEALITRLEQLNQKGEALQ